MLIHDTKILFIILKGGERPTDEEYVQDTLFKKNKVDLYMTAQEDH